MPSPTSDQPHPQTIGAPAQRPGATPRAMKAVVQEGSGSPDALHLRDVERPHMTEDEVLVRVRAASINAADCHLLRVPTPVRALMGRGQKVSPVRGFDLSGRIEAVGARVTEFAPGDEVFGSAPGAFAEFVSTTANRLTLRPRTVSLEHAAAIAVAGVTALQGLRDAARVEPGQRVLIFGAGGGVGTFAVQIAKALGAHVTAATSTRNMDVVRALHPDELIDYTKEDVTARAQHFDVFFDLAATRPLRACRRSLAPSGVFVLAGAAKGGVLTIVSRLLGAKLLSRLNGPQMVSFMARVSRDDLIALSALIDTGRVRPVIDRQFALSEVQDAVRYVASGQARAKVILHIT